MRYRSLMRGFMFKTFNALLAALLLPLAASAQSQPRPDPLDAKAATAPLVYRSPLAGYKKLADEAPPVAWRNANEAVERIGGWRAYAREAAAAASAPAAVATPAAAPTPEPPATRPATPAPGHRH
jgi:hypothetical protein